MLEFIFKKRYNTDGTEPWVGIGRDLIPSKKR